MVRHSHSVKDLIKILIGAAWLDGRIQPEEREYLRKIAQEKGVAEDPEIQHLLDELTTVQPQQCHDSVKRYLGDHPSSEDTQTLIEAIGGLIYSDGDVAIEEAKLINELQQLSQENDSAQHKFNPILKRIQKLYHRWVDVQN
ncbi:MAG: TerB family tellurite resistance protein [Rhizonema sp. NSF051]|nr:TerB family tellurite resistance protein [Rhizonema sp. NSF051]